MFLMEESGMNEVSLEELSAFRDAQRLAFACAADVEAALAPGMTERDAAAMLLEALRAAGVRRFFHVPFAWFGERTALDDAWPTEEFLPSGARLERGMPVILDVAPMIDGRVVDVAHSFAFGDNDVVRRMQDDLLVVRRAIPRALKEGCSLTETYGAVDAILERRGWENRHRAYPFGVLGHRVARLAATEADEGTSEPFGPAALEFFRDRRRAAKEDPSASPFWNDRDDCALGAPPGLWAVEPHLGRGGVGAKFEELLVVTARDAYWLDDDLPHVRRGSTSIEARGARGEVVS